MKGWTTTALAALLAVAVLGAPASAQTAGQAKRFAAAQRLYDQGAYTPALAEFQALAVETSSPNAALYAGRCLRELGKLPEAYEATAAALRDAAAKAETEPKYASTRNTAAADLALLEPRVGKLVVAVADPPADLAVHVGGAALPPARLGVPVVTAIGEVVVRFTAPGFDPVERRVTLEGGKTVTVAVNMVAAKAEAPRPPLAPAAPPAAAPAASPGLGGGRIGGIVVLGAGAAGLVTFAVAGSMANSRYDSINLACGGKRCTDPSYASQIAGGRTLDIAADVGLGVGIAGVVAGTLMVILGGPAKAQAAERATLAPWVGAGASRGGSPGVQGGGLSLRGAF